MIKLLLFDVDGVLTDGSIIVDSHGEALKAFNVRDGLAVALLRCHGIRSGVLSGKASSALDYRVQQLGFDVAVTGTLEKLDAIQQIARDQGLSFGEIAFVGDDVVDLPLAGLVGRFYAPSDAHPLVREEADFVLSLPGGGGAGREAAERVLTESGLSLEDAYAPLLNSWRKFDAAQ